MKSGKSISLNLEIWAAIESFRKKNNISNVSSAIENLLEKKLKELGELK
jgi:hypothetical protein